MHTGTDPSVLAQPTINSLSIRADVSINLALPLYQIAPMESDGMSRFFSRTPRNDTKPHEHLFRLSPRQTLFRSRYERFRRKFSNFAAKQPLTMEQKFGKNSIDTSFRVSPSATFFLVSPKLFRITFCRSTLVVSTVRRTSQHKTYKNKE